MLWAAVARHRPLDLGRPRPLHGHVPPAVPWQVLHGRRLPAGRGRVHLDHRPRRRRAQRVGAPARHRRDRVGAGRPPSVRGGGGGWCAARRQGPGHLRVRDPQGGRRRERRAAAVAQAGHPRLDRRHRLARLHRVHARLAEDPLRQDHAARAAQDRLPRGGPTRRHLDPRGPVHRRQARREGQRAVRRQVSRPRHLGALPVGLSAQGGAGRSSAGPPWAAAPAPPEKAHEKPRGVTRVFGSALSARWDEVAHGHGSELGR
mmetsp:Transcript_51594/g.170971  ORF Transcript_51594/g.170971 Transcript_51594/m.170971 type:complete len:260 (-) Transcript_51594:45-824(-)